MARLISQVPHPHIAARKAAGPVRVVDQLPTEGVADRFNAWLAVKVTSGVGTMWCAYAFAIVALIGLPQAIEQSTAGNSFHPLPIVQWIAQTFLQLVLLSIIIVGQNIQAAAADKRAQATYEDADAVLHTALQIQEHLHAQDAEIERIVEALALRPGPA